ncbi:MAG: asparaginyl/glutamyl-tRNA amidotransferase subunit C [Chloroflexi bacterium RBG_16_57_11]|nr:MAG: asparaginyl/glutamyl-tRNA amidotransferase subunit C [Chloroflexi bacterium RBG_16_57_11]
MTLSLEEVEHIAMLARLNLSEMEKELFRFQLSSILDYVARLQTLDTQDIPPTFSAIPLHGRRRPDEPEAGLQLQDLLRNAPQQEDGQFRIPPVFE